jgi:hypothetical protein
VGTADEYREYAKKCLRWADEAKSNEERQVFLAMAEQWVQAALEIEGVLASSETEERWPPDVRH